MSLSELSEKERKIVAQQSGGTVNVHGDLSQLPKQRQQQKSENEILYNKAMYRYETGRWNKLEENGVNSTGLPREEELKAIQEKEPNPGEGDIAIVDEFVDLDEITPSPNCTSSSTATS